LHSLGKSVQTAQIWIQLIHSYSKTISLMDCTLWHTTNTLSVRTHYSTWTYVTQKMWNHSYVPTNTCIGFTNCT
jgi:hypothetical protein